MIVRIAPVASKNFKTIRTTGTIGGFHMIVSIASTTRDAGVSGSDNRIFASCVSQTSQTLWRILIGERTSSQLSNFLSILRRWQAKRVLRRTWLWLWFNGLKRAYAVRTFFIIFFDFSGVHAEFILDYWNNSDDFWDSLRSSPSSQSPDSVSIWSLQYVHDRPDRPDRTQLYPSRPGRLRSFE